MPSICLTISKSTHSYASNDKLFLFIDRRWSVSGSTQIRLSSSSYANNSHFKFEPDSSAGYYFFDPKPNDSLIKPKMPPAFLLSPRLFRDLIRQTSAYCCRAISSSLHLFSIRFRSCYLIFSRIFADASRLYFICRICYSHFRRISSHVNSCIRFRWAIARYALHCLVDLYPTVGFSEFIVNIMRRKFECEFQTSVEIWWKWLKNYTNPSMPSYSILWQA